VNAVTVELKSLRAAGAAVLGAALLLPLVPFEAGPLCPLRTITGVPCPFCGMTRSIIAVVHGDLARSLVLNPGGILVVGAGVTLLLIRRWQRVRLPVWTVFAFFAALWAYQLFKYATGRPL
jgi:Protein of unknown function (DUF2752)